MGWQLFSPFAFSFGLIISDIAMATIATIIIWVWMLQAVSTLAYDTIWSPGPSNLTSLGNAVVVDPRFSILSEYGWPGLPAHACLITAVHAVAEVALQDFQKLMKPVSVEQRFLHALDSNVRKVELWNTKY